MWRAAAQPSLVVASIEFYGNLLKRVAYLFFSQLLENPASPRDGITISDRLERLSSLH
jgi:hypothetical protein